MKDLHSGLKFVQTIDPAVLTADTDGATVDRQGFESVEHFVCVGESGDTLSGTVFWEFVIQESDNNSDWAAVTSAASVVVGGDGVSAAPSSSGVFATIDAPAEDDKLLRIGYIGGKRYSRIQADATGTHSNGTPIAAGAVLGHPEQAPTAD